MKNDNPFDTDIEMSVSFKHGGLSMTLTARVDATEYPVLPVRGQDPGERLYRVCSDSLQAEGQKIGLLVSQAHQQFAQALTRSDFEDHRASLKASKKSPTPAGASDE